MTSTPFNVGLGDGSRSSSRVLRPPGGGHTDIFGGEPEPQRGRRAGPPQQCTNFIGQGDEHKPTNGTAPSAQNGQAAETQPEPQQTAPEAPRPEPKEVSPAKPEQKANSPVKPEPVMKNSEPLKAEPPKRVRVPPGGFSSGLW